MSEKKDHIHCNFIHVSKLFNPITMFQTLNLLFFLLAVITKVTAQEKTYPITDVGNGCRINTGNIFSGCLAGWQEEKEWNVDNKPVAILVLGKSSNCTDPCLNLQRQEIWLNCTLVKHALVKLVCRCTKEKQLDEATFYFRDIQEQVSPFENLTTASPESLSPTSKAEHMHIGIGISIVIVVLVVLCYAFYQLKGYSLCVTTRTVVPTGGPTVHLYHWHVGEENSTGLDSVEVLRCCLSGEAVQEKAAERDNADLQNQLN
ncbi:uncharacterized protein LOC119965973 isoform X2 [Scyliorhinus canicula]|uniref:uncharacterized protein LOC119965973 isoform X2 n=1 Tax=Scyliorhinus canicula TaxID=7830 RepID=UPI0018F3ACB7|nr:uncharacterized protein LOC119965973 isoform X2 [Scyliorhinus canicula]